jgi:hypothetical protein
MNGFSAMLFATHVKGVATLHDHKNGQGSKNGKGDTKFQHFESP